MQYIIHFLREVDPRALVSANLRKSVFMFLKEPEIAATLFYWLISWEYPFNRQVKSL